MKIKVRIDDKITLERLLEKQPDLEVKIKDALVDEVGKRAAKAVGGVLEKTIECAVESAILNFIQNENPCFTIGGSYYRKTICLKPSFRQEIQKEIDNVLLEEVRGMIANIPEMCDLRKILEEKIEYIKSIDVKNILIDEAARSIRRAWRDFEAIREAAEKGKAE